MTEDVITVTAGAPQVDIEPGVYEVTLTDISEIRTIVPQSGPNAGKEVQLRDWTFALENDVEIRGSASTASGPKSKTYAWLTALLGGTPPAVGQSYPRSQLLGRQVLATVEIDESGWPKIRQLSALPKTTRQPATPIPASQPVRPATARTVAPVAAGVADDLPF